MTEEERFLFDLRGYLVVEDVLGTQEIAALDALIDEYDFWSGSGPDGSWVRIHDDGQLTAGRLHRWGEPFRRLIAHPKVLPYLADLIGPQFRFDDGYVLMMRAGSQSGTLHGGSVPFFHDCYYRVVESRIHNGFFAVSFSSVISRRARAASSACPVATRATSVCPTTSRTSMRLSHTLSTSR